MYSNFYLFCFLLFLIFSCSQTETGPLCDYQASQSNNYVVGIDDLDLNFPYQVPSELSQLQSDLQNYDPGATIEVEFFAFNRTTNVRIENSMNVYIELVMDGDSTGTLFPVYSFFEENCN